jgi:hypothetical protein
VRRIVFFLLIVALAASNAIARGMEFLTFDELRSLANSAELPADEQLVAPRHSIGKRRRQTSRNLTVAQPAAMNRPLILCHNDTREWQQQCGECHEVAH